MSAASMPVILVEIERDLMKTGGIVLSIIGAALFAWHLIRVSSNPDYVGYASHQVMSVNALIVLVFGVTIYLIGKWREKRKRKSSSLRHK